MIPRRAKPLLERWIFVMVKVDSRFLVPYTAPACRRIEEQGGYGGGFAAFLDRFLEALAAPEWAPGSYYPGGWYRGLAAEGVDPLKVEISPPRISAYYQEEFRVEANGEWWVGEQRIENPVRRFFLANLHFDPGLQRYLICYKLDSHYETRYVHHESPPLRVVRVAFEGSGIALTLNDEKEEALRPETLRLDGEERLLCAVGEHRLPALFEDNARWQLLDRVEEEPRGGLTLPLGGRGVTLSLDAPAEFPGGAFPSGERPVRRGRGGGSGP